MACMLNPYPQHTYMIAVIIPFLHGPQYAAPSAWRGLDGWCGPRQCDDNEGTLERVAGWLRSSVDVPTIKQTGTLMGLGHRWSSSYAPQPSEAARDARTDFYTPALLHLHPFHTNTNKTHTHTHWEKKRAIIVYGSSHLLPWPFH